MGLKGQRRRIGRVEYVCASALNNHVRHHPYHYITTIPDHDQQDGIR